MRSVWRLCFSLRLERWGLFTQGGLRRHTLLLRPPKIHDFEFNLAPFIRMTIVIFTRTQMRGRKGLIITKRLHVNKWKILVWRPQYGKKFCSERGCYELQRTCWSLFSIVAKQRVKWSENFNFWCKAVGQERRNIWGGICLLNTHGKLLFLRFLEISIRSRFAHIKTVYSKYMVDI